MSMSSLGELGCKGIRKRVCGVRWGDLASMRCLKRNEGNWRKEKVLQEETGACKDRAIL